MPACGYEFYLLVFNLTSHSFAALTHEISSSTLEDKIHIHVQSCNAPINVKPQGRGGGQADPGDFDIFMEAKV